MTKLRLRLAAALLLLPFLPLLAQGYRGIWYTLGQVESEYGDKYSGGLGTYTVKHRLRRHAGCDHHLPPLHGRLL